MRAPILARIGLIAAAALIALFALAIFLRSRPPAPLDRPLIKELARDTCTVESASESGQGIWILENRLVRVKLHAKSGEILELLSKERGLKAVSLIKEARRERTGFLVQAPGETVYPPYYSSTSQSGDGRASVIFEGRKQGIRHELLVFLRPNSPSLHIQYTCENLTDAPVEGDFRFRQPGRMGELREDDALIVPAAWGVRKLDAPRAYLYSPKAHHPYRNWFACLDGKTKEMLVVALEESGENRREAIISDLTPTGYYYGFSRERLRIESGRTYGLRFSLTPINRILAQRVKDRPWYQEIADLIRNMDLLLETPPGPGRILSASWGIAAAKLEESMIRLPMGTAAKVRIKLNRATSLSPDLSAHLLLREHGADEPILERTEHIRLGGAWRGREKEIVFPISESLLHAGRFDVVCRISEEALIFEDRLNLGVSAMEIPLPSPDLETRRPVERVIARRMSQRVFKDESVDPKVLSYVLAQTVGLVKDDRGRLRDRMIHASRTKPGKYEIFLHFVHEGAIYRYDKERHCLVYFRPSNPYFVSELAEEDILLNPRVRTVQAPILLLIADGGGASDGLFQSFHLAAAAVDLGFCTFGNKSFRWVSALPEYEEMYYGRLGYPFTPFLFSPKEEDLAKENMPQVDASWSDFALVQASKDEVPREPEMLNVRPNLPAVRERGLTLEEASLKAAQVSAFDQGGRLDLQQKSQLLWAAYGRSYLRELQDERDFFDERRGMFVPGGAHRTVPSACGQYLIDCYMADETGIYQYFGKRHHLHRIREGDFRREIQKISGTGFEHPAALFLFAQRDPTIECPEGEGFEEAFFAAQNMSLVGAGMDVRVDLAWAKPPPGSEESAKLHWSRLLGGLEGGMEIKWVGREKSGREGPPIPFAVVAAGPSGAEDIRWWNAGDHPLAFEVSPESLPGADKPAPPMEGAGLDEEILRSLFPESEAFAPGDRESTYHVAFNRTRKKDGIPGRDIHGFAAEVSRIAPEIVGYHGPIEMALALTPHGRIRKLKILRHSETAEHMNRILSSGFCEAFEGKAPGEMAGVDIVSGATATCSAIAQAVQTAQGRLCGGGGIIEDDGDSRDRAVLLKAALLAGLFAAALCLLSAHRAWRYLLLAASACLLGWIWNWSFTYTDLLDAAGLVGILTAVFASLALITTLLKGRIYCGWICPFGAVQEIAALVSSPLRRNKGGGANGKPRSPGSLRLLKFAILPMLIAGALITGIKGYWNPEPFTDFFSSDISSWRFFVGLGALVLALAFSRPFCRFLCPTGALLGSINRLKGRLEKKAEFDACRRCGQCVNACPTKAVEVDEEGRVQGRNRFECIGCEECIKATARGACRENPF